MATKKYMSLDRMREYDTLIKEEIDGRISANKTVVDSSLSPTSSNPVENKVLDAEFEAISTAMNVYDAALDDKADTIHTHEISDINNLQSSLDEVNDALSQKSQVQVITSDASEVLSTLKIHKMTQEQYDQELANGTLDDNAIYLTPDEEMDLSQYATIEYTDSAVATVKNDLLNGAGEAYDTLKELGDLINENTDAIDALEIIANGKANANHTHNDIYYTETEINEKIATINTAISNSITEAKSYANNGDAITLESAKNYTNNAVAQKTQVQIITWEDDD